MSLIKKREAPALLKPAQVSGDPLHIRLRPSTLDGVIGHPGVVKALNGLLTTHNAPHSYLFTGQSGAGKTTIARIVGAMLGCGRGSIIEIDAARYSGVDNMREVILGSNFASLSDSGKKQIVIDECHMLSKGAWNSLLLSIEEPPPHLYWSFCTTEPDKVPNTIRTRCHAFDLKPVPWETISSYLEHILATEDVTVYDPAAVGVIARRSNGSVRQALVYLSTINGIADKTEALKLIESVDSEDGSAIVLARMVCTGRGFTWENAQAQLKALSEESPEGVRLVIVNYAAKMLLDTKGAKEAERLLAVISAFAAPYNSSERQAPLLLSVGSLLFGG